MSDTAESQHSLSNRTKAQLVEELETLRQRVQILHRDESERHRAEEWLKLIIDTVPAGISYFDREQRFRFANEKYESLLGLKPSKLVGKTLEEAIGKKPYEVARQYVQRALSGQAARFENTLPAKNGGKISIVVSYIPDIAPDRTVKGFFALVQDITERKRAEEILKNARDELESRVEQRTAELRETNRRLTWEIAHRERTAKALRESEVRFRDFAEGASDWFWEMDSDLRFTYHSERYFEITGFRPEDKIGTTHTRHVNSTDLEVNAEKWTAHLADIEAHKPFKNFEYRFIAGDGRVLHVTISGTPVFDKAGKFQGYRGTGTDITERKRAEESLQNSEARFRTVIETAVDGVVLIDTAGTVQIYNQTCVQMFGYKPDEVLGQNVTMLMPPSYRVEHDTSLKNYLQTGEKNVIGGSREVIGLRKDGSTVPLELSLGEAKQNGERVFVGILRDITERKRAEQALCESEDRLRRSVLDAPIPIMMHAEGGEVLMISKKWTELSGYSDADIPNILDWTEKAYGADREHMRDLIGGLYEIEEPFEHEAYVTTARGERRIWDFRTAPLGRLPDGRRFVISMAVDVTERRLAYDQLERRVEERTAELRAVQADLLRQERLALLGQLTATVSHELRNPLAVIRTSAFIIKEGRTDTNPRVQRALERIDRSVVRCDRIIDELLDFTRISGLEPEPTPIDAWLDATLKEQALPAGITLRRDFGLAGTTVPFDHDRFRRAIINVFDNACQAMTGEVDPEATDADDAVLSVRTRRKNGRVEVIFEDRGPGIPADVLPKIFEPLFSTKGFGVGLGLPVVKQIMEQHGGGIEIETAEGHGTKVCLWLPTS